MEINPLGFPATLVEINLVSQFGISLVGLRLVCTLLGLVSIFIYWKSTKNLSVLFFALSPFLLYVSFLSLAQSLLLLAATVFFYFCLKGYRKFGLMAFLFLLVALLSMQQSSLLTKLKPENYSYIIDKNLRNGILYETPLAVRGVNLTRISENKIVYSVNTIFKQFSSLLDINSLAFPLETQSQFGEPDASRILLPKLLIWEVPFAAIGLYLLSKERNIRKYLVFLIAAIILFGEESFAFLLPLYALATLTGLTKFVAIFKNRNFKRLFLVSFAVLWLMSCVEFINLFFNNFNKWLPANDIAQDIIWNDIAGERFPGKKILITDRFGDPEAYYLYYFSNKMPMENFTFRSFKYWEEDRMSYDVWVGQPLEFGKETIDAHESAVYSKSLDRVRDIELGSEIVVYE